MITITLAQLKSDIAARMKGTSIRQITDFYGTVASAASRMLSRIDTEETRRIVTITTPLYDNLNDYALATDYKRMIDIYPTANRTGQPGLSDFSQTTSRQFSERLDPNSFSVQWNNMQRTLRAQRLPQGNVITMDSFDSSTANGSWVASVDASGLYSEVLNYIEGNGALGFNLSGVTGSGVLTNSTASVVDLSLYNNQDASMVYFYIPSGFASRFTNFKLRKGTNASNYTEVTVTTKADGTAFTDGYNLLMFQWNTSTTVGTPSNTNNQYRVFTTTYTTGAAINGCLLDNWTDAFGTLYKMEYYSEYLFRTSTGTWIAVPTSDTDLVNVSPSSYEILKAEIMVDITQQIRIGAVKAQELADWRQLLNGTPESRYIRDPKDKGLYTNYLRMFPSSAITTRTSTYQFDL